MRLTGRFTARQADDDFDRIISTSVGDGMSGAVATLSPRRESQRPLPAPSIAPGTFETRFMRLHAEGRFHEMWEMLAEDAQRAWGGRANFVREMPRLDQWMEILELQVMDVKILHSWTDQRHQRAYRNVAQLVMRYRVRQQWREWTFDRQVHLVPAGDGWRTLCYPTRPTNSYQPAGHAVGR